MEAAESDAKPILFIYSNHTELLDRFGEPLREMLLNEYADVFDCFYASEKDWPQTRKLFATSD